MMRRTLALTLPIGVLLALGACNARPSGSATGAGAPAATPAAGPTTAFLQAQPFCAKLQPLIQPLVKPSLALFQASDSSTDPNHAGETPYLDCDFRPPGGQVDVSIHDDTDGRFDNAAEQGYAAQPGFGDKARYLTQPADGMRWVDVVKGKVAC